MQRAHGLGAGVAKLVTTVDQQPQRNGGVVHDDLPQTVGARGNHSDTAGVDRVGLAVLPGGEDPSAGGQFGRDVQHGLVVVTKRWATCRPGRPLSSLSAPR